LAPATAARAQVVALAPHLPQLQDETLSIQAGELTIGALTFLQQDGPGDKLVLGGAFVLREGEILEGSLFVLGGTATLEQGSLVKGDVMLLGGSLIVHGTVEGDIIAIGGYADLSETALIEGDVNAIGGHVTYDDRESIEGDLNTGVMPGAPIEIPGGAPIPDFPAVNMPQRLFGGWMSAVMSLVVWLLKAFLWTGLAALVVLFAPRHTQRATSALLSQPVIAGGLGLLTVFVAPLMLFVIAITIIGIPVSLVGLFLLVAAWAFGLIVIGTEIGKRIAAALNQEWALPVSAALGTLILTLIINGIAELIPCVGWMVPALVGMVGLGAVLLTRFGTYDYPAAPAAVIPAPAASPVPPAQPVPAAVAPSMAPVVESTAPSSTAGKTEVVDEPLEEPAEADRPAEDEIGTGEAE
jgi:hypothetical protein